jgi:hypothetical protein
MPQNRYRHPEDAREQLLRGLDLHQNVFGVRPQGVWTGALQLPEVTYKTIPQQSAFALRLLEQARQIPGVETASLSNRLPLEGGGNYYVQVRGRVSERFSGPLVENHSAA